MKRDLDPELKKLIEPLNEEQQLGLAQVLETWAQQLKAAAPAERGPAPFLPRFPIEVLRRN